MSIFLIAFTAIVATEFSALYLIWRPVARAMDALQQTADAVLARAEARM